MIFMIHINKLESKIEDLTGILILLKLLNWKIFYYKQLKLSFLLKIEKNLEELMLEMTLKIEMIKNG